MRAFLLATLVAACTSRSPEPTASPPVSQAELSGPRVHHMRNCPAAVDTATTKATAVRDGIELMITSPDVEDRRAIVALAYVQSNFTPLPFIPPHSGFHGGPGNIGACPIIHANTIVSWEEIPGGVKIHVKARAARDVSALQDATFARLRALQPPST